MYVMRFVLDAILSVDSLERCQWATLFSKTTNCCDDHMTGEILQIQTVVLGNSRK
jgi:hypothetical protein